jgi:type I restriction enzyme S subunit
MAKKNMSCTYEEKLEKALVSDWEQPYKVPSNWVWTRLESVAEIITGGTPSKNNSSYYGGTFPFIKPADLDQGRFISFASEYLTDEGKNVSRVIRRGATSVCCIGSIGKSGYLTFDATTNQQINSILPDINDLFIYYLSCTEYFVQELWKRSSATTISIINKSKMSEIQIPLPPLAEQQRIVERIESLFSKLDEAKENTQNALDSFENRKSAILHKAFTGELTQKWREENDVNLESWAIKEFSEVAKIKSNLVQPIDYLNAPHIAPDNIEKKTGVLLAYNTIAEDGVTSGKHRFYSGQILYSKIRPYLSKVVMVDFDGLCSADMYPIEANENVKYLWYYMLSDAFLDQASNAGSRSVLPKINQKEMSKIRVPMCNLEEQDEIVRILDKIFEKERQAKELTSVIEKIELMKKVILSRAFRGKLGTNNSEEESALELLKEILSGN